MAAIITLSALSPAFAAGASSPLSLEKAAERADLYKHFQEAGTEGTMLIRRVGNDMLSVINPARAAKGHTPASTFKILNSLMALEAGLVRDVDRDLFKYSGTPYLWNGKPFLPEACNQDIGLRAAFANSCIPLYQEIARKLGLARYKQVIAEIGYGNGVLDQAPADAFWLEGGYKVTPLEQISFLSRLHAGDLPFSKVAMDATREIMIQERTPDFIFRAKTGYLFSAEPALGWLVGWVEKGGETHIFALNLDIKSPEHAKARKTIAVKVLQALGAM